MWPMGSTIKACALRACHSFVLSTPKYVAFPSLLFGDSAGTASGPAPVTFLGPERSRSAISFHSVGPLPFIPQGRLSCFLPWNSNGSDPGFPSSPPNPQPSSPGLPVSWLCGSCAEVCTSRHGCGLRTIQPLFISFCFNFEARSFLWKPLWVWPHRPCLGGRHVSSGSPPPGVALCPGPLTLGVCPAPLEGRRGDRAEVGWRAVERRQLGWAGPPVHNTALSPRLGGGRDVGTQFRV